MSDPLNDGAAINEIAQKGASAPSNAEVAAVAKSEQATKEAETDHKVSNLDNKVAELLRKVNKISEVLPQLTAPARVAAPQVEQNYVDDSTEFMTKAEYKAYEAQRTTESLKLKQRDSYKAAMELYPELAAKDSEFYSAVDQYFSRNFSSDPNGPLEAAEFVAYKLGLSKQRIEKEVLNDETRRTRLLSEGGISPKTQKTEQVASKLNENRLKNLLGVDPEKIKARIKADPTRYTKTRKGE